MTDPTDAGLNHHTQAANDTDRAKLRHASLDQDRPRQFATEAARLLRDLHCQDVLLLDVRGRSNVTDFILIASGTSDRQIRSVSDDLEELAESSGMQLYGRDVDTTTSWMVLDFVDVMAHLFHPEARAHYDLEMLWADAPKVDWE